MLCKDCGIELPKSIKPNLSQRCFQCRRIAIKSSNNPTTRQYQAEYRAKHREKRLAEKRAWYQANKKHKLQKDRQYREDNIERWRQIQNTYQKKRIAADPQYKLRKILRGSLRRGIFESPLSILDLIDCTIKEMKMHIESQFTAEMTWENHGSVWHIDHIKPLCAFNLTQEDQIREAVRRSNLRPLLKKDNIKKSSEDKKWKI